MTDRRPKPAPARPAGPLACLAAALALAGCAWVPWLDTVPPPASPDAEYVIAAPFVEADFAAYDIGGNAAITGQAYMQRGDGQVEVARRQEVVLVPWNAYTQEIRAAAEAGYQGLANRDPRYDRYRRTTTTDDEGRFSFDHLPGGDWSLMTSVFWEENGQRRGDFLYENVSLAPGTRARVVVTR